MLRTVVILTAAPLWMYSLISMTLQHHILALFIFVAGFLLYSYWRSRPTGHRVVFVDTPRNKQVKAMCPSWDEYRCPLLLGHGYMQTLFGAFCRYDPPRTSRYWREEMKTPDGGLVALDWSLRPELNEVNPETPTILLFHGLAGSSQSVYIRWMVLAAEEKGFQCVVMNNRGCGDAKLATPRPYSGAFTGDIHLAIRTIREKHLLPSTKLFLVGFSCGASLTVKTLSELGESEDPNIVNGAVACCPAFNMIHSTSHCERPLSVARHVINRVLTLGLVDWLRRNQHIMKLHPLVDIKHAMSSITVREYDSRIVVPCYGYKDVWEYYRDCSSADRVDSIKVPLLCLNAEDDPICRPDSIPWASFESNPNLFLAFVPNGGHLGWIQNSLTSLDSSSWMDHCAVEFLTALMTLDEKTIPSLS